MIQVITILQNTARVETQILWITLSMPRALLLFVTLLIGVTAGLLLAQRMDRKKKKK